MSTRALLGLVVFGVILWGLFGEKSPNVPASQTERVAVAARPAPPDPTVRLELTKTSWRRGGFDTVAIGTFTVTNRNDFAVKDVRLSCEFFAKSGTPVNRHSVTLFETIPAGKSRTIRDISIGFINQQAERGGCNIVGAI